MFSSNLAFSFYFCSLLFCFLQEYNSKNLIIFAAAKVFNCIVGNSSISSVLSIQEDISLQMSVDSIRFSTDVVYEPITIYGMKSQYLEIARSRYLPHVLDCLKPGVVIYINTEWSDQFFDKFYGQIDVPFVLVTGGSDQSSPKSNKLLNAFSSSNSKIIHWFAQNCAFNPDPTRFTCLMLGVGTNNVWTPNERYTGSEILVKEHLFRHVTESDKDTSYDLLLPAFNLGTHNSRKMLWNQFCNGNLDQTVSRIHKNVDGVTSLCGARVPTREMFKLTEASKFVISPHGMGLDCYRTWETLYLGAYPVVRASSLDEMYKDLPVLIVNDWTDITPSLLNRTYAFFSRSSHTFKKLRPSYWRDLFHSYGHRAHSYLSSYSPTVLLTRLGLKEGSLIKGDMKLIYVIRNQTKCAINSLEIFLKHPPWDFSDVIKISEADISEIPDGPDIE